MVFEPKTKKVMQYICIIDPFLVFNFKAETRQGKIIPYESIRPSKGVYLLKAQRGFSRIYGLSTEIQGLDGFIDLSVKLMKEVNLKSKFA